MHLGMLMRERWYCGLGMDGNDADFRVETNVSCYIGKGDTIVMPRRSLYLLSGYNGNH